MVAGIALLIAGLVLAYNKVEWFRNGVNAFFQGVSDVAVEVFNFIGDTLVEYSKDFGQIFPTYSKLVNAYSLVLLILSLEFSQGIGNELGMVL